MRRHIRSSSSSRRWSVAAALSVLSALFTPALAMAQERPPAQASPAATAPAAAPLPSSPPASAQATWTAPPGAQQPYPPPPGAYAWGPSGPPSQTPAPEAPKPAEGPAGWRRGFGFRLHAGGSWQSFYSTGIYGARFGAAAGGTLEHVALWGELEGFVGVTEFGLPVRMFRPSFVVETHLGDFRLGGGVGLLALGVSRATSSSSMTAAAVGLSAHLSYDLVIFDQHAIYIAARMNVDPSSTMLWGPSGSLGFRY
ncbi:hypothetical protein [Sorangium sp. So ce131]|uniref:hypothetical protein n=1 Tax=Sorangium sp. So ce131 TaxID=3133282 RepID=UPI003F5FDD4C